MLISCRTSSYFSSIDIQWSSSSSRLVQVFDPVQEVLLSQPQRVDFMVVAGRAQFLEPVDFPLDGRPVPLPPDTLERAGTLERGCRGGGCGGDAGYQLGVHST